MKFCACLVIAVCLPPLASGQIGLPLVQVTPDAQLLPPGFSYHTFDLRWDHPSGHTHWTSALATFTLTSASLSFYQAQGGDAIAQLMPPMPSEVAADPALAWDTFVTAPFAFPNVNDDTRVQMPSFAAPPAPASTAHFVEAIWFAPLLDQQTLPYSVARFTIQGPLGLELTLMDTGMPVGSIIGSASSVPPDGGGPHIIEATVYVVPEPAGWLALAALALVLRRR
jgi:hypothetical protein